MTYIKTSLVWAAAAALLLSAGCKKDDDKSPYIILKNSSGQVMPVSTASIPAGLNTTVRIYAEAGYERFSGNTIDYQWRIGGGDYRQYSSIDGLSITSLGSLNNLLTQKATLDITFDENSVSPGQTVTIRIKDRATLERTLAFTVE